MRLGPVDREQVLSLYASGLNSREVARRVECTHVYVIRIVRDAQQTVRSAGRPRLAPRFCAQCGKSTKKRRFCTQACYWAWIHNPSYFQQRNHQRVSRQLVETAGMVLLPGYVVHHEDGDNRNTRFENLWVFKCQGDHMSYHRLKGIVRGREPIWCGIKQLWAL